MHKTFLLGAGSSVGLIEYLFSNNKKELKPPLMLDFLAKAKLICERKDIKNRLPKLDPSNDFKAVMKKLNKLSGKKTNGLNLEEAMTILEEKDKNLSYKLVKIIVLVLEEYTYKFAQALFNNGDKICIKKDVITKLANCFNKQDCVVNFNYDLYWDLIFNLVEFKEFRFHKSYGLYENYLLKINRSIYWKENATVSRRKQLNKDPNKKEDVIGLHLKPHGSINMFMGSTNTSYKLPIYIYNANYENIKTCYNKLPDRKKLKYILVPPSKKKKKIYRKVFQRYIELVEAWNPKAFDESSKMIIYGVSFSLSDEDWLYKVQNFKGEIVVINPDKNIKEKYDKLGINITRLYKSLDKYIEKEL